MIRSFVPALGAALLCSGLAHAQPIHPPPLSPIKTVNGRVWVSEEDGTLHLTVNRSETYSLVNDGNWERVLRGSADQEVEARILIVAPGMFGGSARVLGLTRDVKGQVNLPMGGAPMIAVNKSQNWQLQGEAFKQYLLARLNQEVEARIKVVEPGMFGGKVEVVAVYRDTRGRVVAAMDGGPVNIVANKSNSFQVTNDPFKGLLLSQADQQVSARLKVTSAGMFGGEAEVLHLDGRTTKNKLLRGIRAGKLINLGYVPSGSFVEVTGVSRRFPSYLEVTLEDGRKGLISRNAIDLTQPIPLHGAGITATLENE